MANDVFASGNGPLYGGAMTVSVQGLKDAQDRLTGAALAVSPSGGLRSTLLLATGMVHRYLLGLGADHPPIDQKGVLPVQTGRLKNSLFWLVESKGNSLVGRVTSNVAYAPAVEDRRGFMAKTVKDQRGPVNDLISADINRKITRGTK